MNPVHVSNWIEFKDGSLLEIFEDAKAVRDRIERTEEDTRIPTPRYAQITPFGLERLESAHFRFEVSREGKHRWIWPRASDLRYGELMDTLEEAQLDALEELNADGGRA